MTKLTVMIKSIGQEYEALPVRAIPFVSGWVMSPDMVASAFSKTDDARRMRYISSYRIVNDAAGAVNARDWDHVTLALARLDEDIPKGKAGYARWRDESVRDLPPGVFVWLDEFERSFKSDFSQDNWIGDDREELASLDLSPLLAPGLHKLILEGFDAPTSTSMVAKETPTAQTPDTDVSSCPNKYGQMRDEWIFNRVKELRASRSKAFLGEVAREISVSVSAVKQAITRHEKQHRIGKYTDSDQSNFAGMLQAASRHKK
mgnify:CR=1 FL=1